MPQPDENARWARFLRMLDEWDELTQERAAQYLDLALSDPDVNGGEARSFASWLIRSNGHRARRDRAATPSDLESRKRSALGAACPPASRTGLTDDMHVHAAIQLGARNVHLWLLDNIHLSRGALERLQVEGVTRAIRNRAAQRVRLR